MAIEVRQQQNPLNIRLELGEIVQLDPVLVPVVEAILLDGSDKLGPSQVYQVTYEIVNIDGAASVIVTIGVKVGGADSNMSGAELHMKSVIIPAKGSSGPKVITIGSDDDIRGVASAADDAAIHFIEVRRVA